MHGHYLLKLTASQAQVRKCHCIPLYSCKSFVLNLMCIIPAHGYKAMSICHTVDNIMKCKLKFSYLNYLKSLTSQ